MKNLFKLFKTLVGLVMPKLDITSGIAAIIVKVLFALIIGGVVTGGAIYVKNAYNDYKTKDVQLDNANRTIGDVVDKNKKLTEGIDKVIESGNITQTIVDDANKDKSDIRDFTSDVLDKIPDVKPPVKTVSKPTNKNTPNKTVTNKPDKAETTPEVSKQTVTNITAMWESYCGLGGDKNTCELNT